MVQELETHTPTYQAFRQHASFVPELSDFAVNERQFVQLLAEAELHWGGGSLGTGDLPILFNRAASGSNPALGGTGLASGKLIGKCPHVTYEGVRSICKILTARTSKTRQSYAETAQAKAEAAAKEEANRRASENLSLRGQASRRHSSQEEKSPPRQFRGPVCSKLEESMTHCQAPPPSTSFFGDDSSEEETEAWRTILPGRRPKPPSRKGPILTAPPEPTEELIHNQQEGDVLEPPADADENYELAEEEGEEQQGEGEEGVQTQSSGQEGGEGEGTAAEQGEGKAGADAQQGEGAEAQPEDPSLQGATQEPSLAEEAHRGESKEPEGATVKFDETLRESSGGWVGGLSGRASLSGLWLTKDPPALVPAAVLPPACEFAPIRAMIGKIQALIRKGDLSAVGPMLKPLVEEWQEAVADAFTKELARRAKLAKQNKAKNKGAAAAEPEEELVDDGSIKEVPTEAAIWLLLIAGRCALEGDKVTSARMFMDTAQTHLQNLEPMNHSYHVAVPMSQGAALYAAGEYASAATHFANAHARSKAVASCTVNPLAARNAAASLNNWGAAAAMMGEKAVAVRCFRATLSMLDTRSPPGYATGPPKPPPPAPAADGKKGGKRPASAPAAKGAKAAPPPAWGGGGSLDNTAATTAAKNLSRVLHASFASSGAMRASQQAPPFLNPTVGRGLDFMASQQQQQHETSHSTLGIHAFGSVSASADGGKARAAFSKSAASPGLLSGFALASNPLPRKIAPQNPQQKGSGASFASAVGRPSTAPAAGSQTVRSIPVGSLTQAPTPMNTFIHSMIATQPSQAPVEAMPKWAVRATEASMEEKAKGKKAPAKKDAPAKGKDGKGAPKKKKPAGFVMTFPADYYGLPSYGLANVKGLVAKKGGAKKGSKKK